MKLYYEFFKKGGRSYFLFTQILMATSVGLRIFIDYFIGSWIEDEYGLSYNTYVGLLFLFAGITNILLFLRGLAFGHYIAIVCIRVIREFIAKLFRKSMTFFDTTPSGQI